MTDKQIFNVRIGLIRAFLWERKCDGILLNRCDNFAMATGGRRNYIYTYGDLGANGLFVSKEGRVFFVGNNIEVTRQMAEELGSLGCDVLEFTWFQDTPAGAVRKRFPGTLVSDDGSLGANVNDALTPLRALLTEGELEKYRRLGALAADAMSSTLDAIRAGMTEHEIAATLISEGAKRRCHIPVTLVAADKRIAQFRHPLPTQERLLNRGLQERAVLGYVMVVGCFLREGLVVSITRFKQVGPIAADVPSAMERIAAVDATMQEATCPGRTMGDVFTACQKAYAEFGFRPDEWHNHHQGGSTGYAGRTCKAVPNYPFPILDRSWAHRAKEFLGEEVELGMAFAWNPSAPGVKSEDTFVLLPDGRREIVTLTPALPTIDLERVLGRPTEVVKAGMVAG